MNRALTIKKHFPVAFREYINGLRTLAIVAVLFFHFQVPSFGAEFIGVGIFFVISGYLMTAIIMKGLEAKRFSIFKLYMARNMPNRSILLVVIVPPPINTELRTWINL